MHNYAWGWGYLPFERSENCRESRKLNYIEEGFDMYELCESCGGGSCPSSGVERSEELKQDGEAELMDEGFRCV